MGTWVDPFKDGSNFYRWDGRTDHMRGWVIAFCWFAASCCECVLHLGFLSIKLTFSSISVVYLYHIVRRPRLILDFALTLVFNHIVLTTYYSAALPSSLFFWFVLGACTAGMVVGAEQLCVRREMKEGLQTLAAPELDEIELGTRGPSGGLRRD